jgi:hypothetical protein
MAVEIGAIGTQIEIADGRAGGADPRALAGETDGLLAAIGRKGKVERSRAGRSVRASETGRRATRL